MSWCSGELVKNATEPHLDTSDCIPVLFLLLQVSKRMVEAAELRTLERTLESSKLFPPLHSQKQSQWYRWRIRQQEKVLWSCYDCHPFQESDPNSIALLCCLLPQGHPGNWGELPLALPPCFRLLWRSSQSKAEGGVRLSMHVMAHMQTEVKKGWWKMYTTSDAALSGVRPG